MLRCGETVVAEEEEDDDEYAKLVRRMNPPRVVIDNDSCDNATVIRVDRVKKHGILLEAVQVLVDLNLVITKAYISSDGNWFMDGTSSSYKPPTFFSLNLTCNLKGHVWSFDLSIAMMKFFGFLVHVVFSVQCD